MMDMTMQEELFAASEGDRWFERNRAALDRFDPEADLPLRMLTLYGVRPRKVLEIGACNGFRLAFLSSTYGSHAVAVEASQAAIDDGRRRFGQVRFVRGIASGIPLADAFDTVIVNSVLHWVDRRLLLSAVAEIDRLLSPEGVLVLGDFSPAVPTRVSYHHLPHNQVFTYKQNYSEIFVASGIYLLLGSLTADHATKEVRATVADDNRVSVWLLKKTLNGGYVDRACPVTLP